MAGQQSGRIERTEDPEQTCAEEYGKEQRKQLQKAFGYTYEEYKNSIRTMALNGGESIAAMGVDTPLAVLSEKQQTVI